MDRPKTYGECLELSRQVEYKQKGIKREALSQVNDVFDTAIHKKNTLYSVVPGVHCRKCGGIILKRESILPMATPGGNPIKGCITCETMSWKLNNPDIVLDTVEKRYDMTKQEEHDS